MDLAANELSIFDKLSETVDLVRQTGHQCGMSEKAIEKFIRQLLEKNEPQRGPPQYPLLLAVYKVFITLGLILLTAYFVIQPFSPLAPEPVLSGAYTWRSLIHHIRLMSLPITKKYMPETKGAPLHGGNEDRPFPDFDPWWTNDCEQNESDPIPANCTGCAQKLPLQVMLLEDTPRKFERLHPLVIKTGQSLSTEGLQDFLCQYPEVTEGFTEGFFTKWWRCFPGRWFPFPYPWRRPLNRSHILHELFPVFTYLPFPKEASLKKCFLLQPEPIVGSKRWDEELAAFAKAYAQQCVWGHNKDRGRRGENLFAITGEGLDVPLAMEEWHHEREHYNLSAISCAAGQMCGHYTQVVWAKTERIGCGSHFCEKLQGVEETDIHLLVCNYEPPGNVKGQRPYQEGTPCSQCPLGYHCKNSLCEPIRGPEEAQDLSSLVPEAPSSLATEASSSRKEGIDSSLATEPQPFLTKRPAVQECLPGSRRVLCTPRYP
uniref:Peptidase inhibitor 16 n=1 Tax=Capra hircus TaxID=9925 RepID=A0A8C2S641_CAPHI